MSKTGFVKKMAADGVTFVIREADEKDLPSVTDLHAYNTGQHKPDYWEETYHRYGDSNEGFFYVCEIDGAFAGFIIGEVRAWEFGSEPCGWVYTIGVNPEMRLKQVGTRLFETVSDEFRNAGVSQIRTMLHRQDNLNLSFFRSQGMMGGPYIELEMPLD
ncbi:MAG: GNAT family N-acetyltransferase [Methylocystaceae bacterium]|nr:GNAT family N-acetyltransferase [Methylocystaceae bacterium]